MRSKALVVAYAVHETGVREVIDLGIGEVESGGFWIEFLRSLRARGLDGVQLAVSDHYEGSSTQSLRCSPAPGSLARCTSCALVLVTTTSRYSDCIPPSLGPADAWPRSGSSGSTESR